jgi:hypothetical protein
MATTIQSLVDRVSNDLLEPRPPGLITGLVTQQQILDYIGLAVTEFLRDSGLIQTISTQRINAGVSQYQIPDLMTEARYAFVDGKIIEQVDFFSNYLQGHWQRPGPTRVYHQDGLPIKVLELIPPPATTGAVVVPGSFQPGGKNLTLVGPSLSSKEQWLIGDTLDTIPDSFTGYIVYSVLEKIFSADGETKDQQRAMYCQSRVQEGILLARSILLELYGESAEASA